MGAASLRLEPAGGVREEHSGRGEVLPPAGPPPYGHSRRGCGPAAGRGLRRAPSLPAPAGPRGSGPGPPARRPVRARSPLSLMSPASLRPRPPGAPSPWLKGPQRRHSNTARRRRTNWCTAPAPPYIDAGPPCARGAFPEASGTFRKSPPQLLPRPRACALAASRTTPNRRRSAHARPGTLGKVWRPRRRPPGPAPPPAFRAPSPSRPFRPAPPPSRARGPAVPRGAEGRSGGRRSRVGDVRESEPVVLGCPVGVSCVHYRQGRPPRLLQAVLAAPEPGPQPQGHVSRPGGRGGRGVSRAGVGRRDRIPLAARVGSGPWDSDMCLQGAEPPGRCMGGGRACAPGAMDPWFLPPPKGAPPRCPALPARGGNAGGRAGTQAGARFRGCAREPCGRGRAHIPETPNACAAPRFPVATSSRSEASSVRHPSAW